MSDDDPEVEAHLLCVAPCDSDDAFAAHSPRLRGCLLFSLQFYVDRVVLDPIPSSPSRSNPLLLAFQLLQYEIVVFDAALASSRASSAPSEATVTRVGHGKSCLFQAEPDRLARELQQDAETPLTLLLLAKEHGRARLRAFAAVPLSLHVGLLDDDVLSYSNLLRICEWASQGGTWELRDHHNAVVGSVTGAVTLSCLGKTLAPHLTQVLGVQVNKSQPSSPRVEGGPNETKEQAERPPSSAQEQAERPPSLAQETAEEAKQDASWCATSMQQRVEKQDSSVQCDEDLLVQDAVDSPRSSLSLRDGSSNDDIQLERSIKTNNSSAERRMLYYEANANARSSTRRVAERLSRESRRGSRAISTKGDLLFPRELPPPLFFHKGPKA